VEVWAADSASLPTKYFLKTLGSRSDAEMINFGGGALCTYVGEARSASAPRPHPRFRAPRCRALSSGRAANTPHAAHTLLLALTDRLPHATR